MSATNKSVLRTNYSVFIPRVFSNISEHRIAHVFHRLDIGSVEKIDLVKKDSLHGKSHNIAFIHFSHIYDTPDARTFLEDMEVSAKAKICYDDPWFWLVLPFKKKENPTVNTNTPPISHSFPHIEPSQDKIQYYSPEQLVPMCMITPYGPYMYWGIPQQQPTQQQHTNYIQPTKMIPPQVMYGKNYYKQRRHPRKRINVPDAPVKKEETVVENPEKDIEE